MGKFHSNSEHSKSSTNRESMDVDEKNVSFEGLKALLKQQQHVMEQQRLQIEELNNIILSDKKDQEKDKKDQDHDKKDKQKAKREPVSVTKVLILERDDYGTPKLEKAGLKLCPLFSKERG